jgi:hypothetical protein
MARWDILATPANLPLTRDRLVNAVQHTDGVDVGEIVWEYDGMPGFGFTVVGNETAAFGRFLLAVTRMFEDDPLTQIFVDRVVVGRSGGYKKVVFFPVQLLND